jgi:predicted DNA-binding protein
MEILSRDDLIEHVNELIDYLSEHEDAFYVALDVAHQLRDEIIQVTSEEQPDE